MPPKKRSYPCQEKLAREFRLRVTSSEAHGGVVNGAVCRFCECFVQNVNNGERKRKCTTRIKHWNGVFCSENIHGHMVEQNPIKFAEYTALTKQSGTTSANLHKFFEQAKVNVFFKKRYTIIGGKRVFTVNKAIVEVIVQEFMLPAARGDDDDDDDGKGPIPGDRDMNMFVPQYVVADDGAKVMSCYLVTIANPLHYDYIVALLSAGLSFFQISRMVQENRDRLGATRKLGGVSEGDASNF